MRFPAWLRPSTIDHRPSTIDHRPSTIDHRPSTIDLVFIGSVLVLLGLKGALAVASTPYELDSNTYHLPMSASFLQIHATNPAQVMFYPANGELLDALGVGALGAIGGQSLTEIVVLLALFLAAYGMAESLGARHTTALAAAASVTAIPIVADQAMTAQNDILVAACLLAGIAVWRSRPTLAAIAFGLAAGTKFTGVVECMLVIAVLWGVRSPRLRLGNAFMGIALGAPWYVQTAMQTHNPLFLGSLSGGNTSTIWDHIGQVWYLVISSIRNYGGLVAIIGVFATFLLAALGREPFFRRLLIIVVGVLALWMAIPNSAEVFPGSLDQIRAGWSIRYAIVALSLLDIIAVIVLARWRNSAALAVALLGVLFVISRELGAAEHIDSGAITFSAPLVAAIALLIVAWDARTSVLRTMRMVGALLLAVTVITGTSRIASNWSKNYEAAGEMGAGSALAVPAVFNASRLAAIEVPPLPLIGPNMRRYVVTNRNGVSVQSWWISVLAERPQAIVARDLRQHPGTLSTNELFLRSMHKYRMVYRGTRVRVYVPTY